MTWRHLFEWLVHSHVLRSVAHGTVKAFAAGVVYYFVIYFLERASGAETTPYKYRRRSFIQDVVYWFYYASGLNRLLFAAAILSFLDAKVAVVHLGMVDSMPVVVRGALWLLVTDFSSYWVHRFQHMNRFVWPFHATHHSQEELNFLTTTRFHPLDHFMFDIVRYVPMLMLGASPTSWLPLYFTLEFIAMTHHSQIKWRFGPLSKVLVTPRFHSFHHSADPRHYNKNFGALLTIWDHAFGTAVDAAEEQPKQYGLRDIKMPTLTSTLLMPFGLIRQTYAGASSSPNNGRNAIAASRPAGEPHGG